MLLKKLIVNGFKSFCDYSEITFDQGISAIVGPNGCGKSNIVDAIKWVIGEQKTRMLRANNMTDVIFKGTEEKRGLGRAEVKLILVNENNILPLEYNEIEISRTIYASGENEYYINKDKVRLKDIQELFFDTGVGKSAYSFMEQGKIDLILSTKPEDRRYIIEEAAGITKYKSKKDDALSKLKQSDENILRVKDILKEVKTQYDHMKEQAKKAIRFKEIYDQEMNLEIELNLNRVVRQKKIKEDFVDKLNKVETDLEDVKKKMANMESNVAEKMVYLNELENQKIDTQREVFQIESEIKVINSKLGLHKDQLINLNSTMKSDEEKIKLAEDKIGEIDEELDYIAENQYETEEKIENLKKDHQFYQNNLTEADQSIRNYEAQINKTKKEIQALNQNLDEKQSGHRQITDQLIEKINQSLNILDVNAKEIMDLKTGLSEQLKEIINELKFRRGFIDDILSTGLISQNTDDLLKRLGDYQTSMNQLGNKLDHLDQNMVKYIKTTEIFMDDIFSPEGVLQKKRQIEKNIQEISGKITIYNQNIAAYQAEIDLVNQKKEQYREVLSELKINQSTMQEKLNSIQKEREKTVSLKTYYQANRDELIQKRKLTLENIEELREDIDELDYNLNQLIQQKDEKEKFLKEMDIKIQKENTQMSEQQKYIKEINDKWINRKSDIERLHIKIAEAETTIKNIYDTFYENFSINLSEYESKGGFITNRSYEEIRGNLAQLRQEKSSLGNVNLMAIEESKVLEERYQLLNSQLTDLEEAKKDLLKVIDELKKVSEELFLTTFNQIKINFHKLFRKLFDGGNADIKLTDSSNILGSGISIIAHPPGQKTQSITLLSGGQRTMTAISLMFATFLVKPSPFCLLDEIDAALDEENVTRFINLLHEFRNTSQFIIITHNKKTISAADVMYGVTQEQKGISKIVSAKLVKKADNNYVEPEETDEELLAETNEQDSKAEEIALSPPSASGDTLGKS